MSSTTYTAGINALPRIAGADSRGGNQPPGSGNTSNRLIDSVSGISAAATLAGEQTLDTHLKSVPLRVVGSPVVLPIPFDKKLDANLEAGNDWVRVNLTAHELLAKMKLSLIPAVDTRLEEIVVSPGNSAPITLTKPDEGALQTAVLLMAQELSGTSAPNRDEIVWQANDAGLAIARALKLEVVRDRHFLYLFDVLELVLASPLYEAKLHFNVDRPSKHPDGATIQPVVPIPRHQSFPSGHASYSWALVELVMAILRFNPAQEEYLRALAERITLNRQAAGLHTQLDSDAGRQLGESIGRWLGAAAYDIKNYPKWAALAGRAQASW
jgi:hypothetical protein